MVKEQVVKGKKIRLSYFDEYGLQSVYVKSKGKGGGRWYIRGDNLGSYLKLAGQNPGDWIREPTPGQVRKDPLSRAMRKKLASEAEKIMSLPY